MTVVTIIGAGSTVFAAELISDFLTTPGLDSGEFRLVDIDAERLALAHEFAEYLIGRSERTWQVQSSTDRTQMLPGSSVIISTIEVAGLPTVDFDYEIPLKYGVDQCIGDTIGPGGLFKSLRTIPTFLEILADVERLAPDALVLNHTNPMSMTILAASRASGVPVWGMCHSVHHTVEDLAGYLGIDHGGIQFDAAGVNHLAWLTTLERDGVDLYPELRQRARSADIYQQDPVRFELMYQFGAFPTESSGHVSEYLPYFRTHADLVAGWKGQEYIGESGFYAHNWPTWRRENDEMLRSALRGDTSYPLERGPEYPSQIVEAMSSQSQSGAARIYVTTPNRGWIENVHQDNAVEVAAIVDSEGIHPQKYGRLPEHMASWVRRHQEFNDLAVTSILEQDREAAVHALMLDPLTSAASELGKIREMFDEMVSAQRAFLPAYLH
ncbi:MAG: alpha-glucosidase/alpha-galactosidase [Actinomycetes bacterium]